MDSNWQVGDNIPEGHLFEDSPANKVNICDLTSGKKIVLFAVPGAFTPGCSKTHLPGYIQNAEKMKSEGISEIVCVAVNDPYVMAAWGAAHKTKGKVCTSFILGRSWDIYKNTSESCCILLYYSDKHIAYQLW